MGNSNYFPLKRWHCLKIAMFKTMVGKSPGEISQRADVGRTALEPANW